MVFCENFLCTTGVLNKPFEYCPHSTSLAYIVYKFNLVISTCMYVYFILATNFGDIFLHNGCSLKDESICTNKLF